MKRLIGVLALVIGLFLSASGLALANASNGQDTCPEGAGWVKVDGLNSVMHPVTAPADQLIVEVCAKSSTNIAFLPLDPGVSSFIFVSGEGWLSGFVNHRGIPQNLSHVSYRLAGTPVTTSPTTTTPTETTETTTETTPVTTKPSTTDVTTTDVTTTVPSTTTTTTIPTTVPTTTVPSTTTTLPTKTIPTNSTPPTTHPTTSQPPTSVVTTTPPTETVTEPPATTQTTEPPTRLIPPTESVDRNNCDELTSAQAQRQLDNGATHLDRDGDGVACDTTPVATSLPNTGVSNRMGYLVGPGVLLMVSGLTLMGFSSRRA